ncbi:MAG: hypothetical protein JWN70_2948 [Planctomycetaceae bacterium]|nr:hypothetical protein [Planctomycetaceae bacterium]
MVNLQLRSGVATRRRRGWTLIEMLVTISVMASITGIAIKILTTLLRAERNGIEHVTRLTTVSRLSRQFRADVRAATELQLSGDNPQQPLLRVTSEDQRQIQYEIHPQGLLRTEKRPGQPLTVTDLLRFKNGRFRIVESPAPPRLLTLVIETPDTFAIGTKQPAGDSRELHIEALVGRDFRDH